MNPNFPFSHPYNYQFSPLFIHFRNTNLNSIMQSINNYDRYSNGELRFMLNNNRLSATHIDIINNILLQRIFQIPPFRRGICRKPKRSN